MLGFLKRLFGGGAPAVPRSGLGAYTMFGGRESLEVVGESHYQEALRRLVGSTTERVRVAVVAILVPEPDNEYDPNAVSVWISGQKVGYLSREDAAKFQPALRKLQPQIRTAIALPGVMAGGGDGRPSIGVFLNYDPPAFGLSASGPVVIRTRRGGIEVRIRTGLSDATAGDEEDDDYDLSWEERMPADRLKAMAFLRQELRIETEPVSRHFMYAQLEGLLYGARDELESALRDYDATCEAHHAEMATIRPALITTFGGLPLLETYKQAAIRHQKAHDWQAALRWADLGIAVYGSEAVRPEFSNDLQIRRANYSQKLEPSQSRPGPPGLPKASGAPILERLVCDSCGMPFERTRTRGRKPHQCPACRGVAAETGL